MTRVEIIWDSRLKACDVDCGADWSRPAVLEEARQALARRFGESVTLGLVDIAADTAARRRYGTEQGIPLLVVNGTVRLSGQFDIRRVIDAVETEQEIGVNER